MPLQSRNTSGGVTVTSSSLSTQRELSFNANAQSEELYVESLPNLVFWVMQTAGAAPATIIPQFSIVNITGGAGVPVPEFLPLTAPIVLPALNVPLLLYFRLPCNRIRIDFTPPGGQATTVDYVISAYSP